MRAKSQEMRLNDKITHITCNPSKLVIGQIIRNQTSYMRTHAVSEHVYILHPRSTRMILQVPYQLSNTS